MRSPTQMEKELRALLKRPDTRLRATELHKDTLAWAEFDGHHVQVAVDPMRGGLIECVIHELLHAQYAKPLGMWGKFEEAIVLAVEAEMMAFINRDEKRVRWWRDAIHAKLDGEDD